MFDGVTNEIIHPGGSHDFKGFRISEIFDARHGIGRNNPDVPGLDQTGRLLAGRDSGFPFLNPNDLLGLMVVAGNGSASLDFDFREHDPFGGENPYFNSFRIRVSGKVADGPLRKIFKAMVCAQRVLLF
jgi:hypothetical protein